MAELLRFNKGNLLNFALTFIGCFFFVTAGWGQDFEPNPSAYSDLGLPNPTVTSDKEDYAPGEVAIISGTGWTEDSIVDIHIEEEPTHIHHHGFHNTTVKDDGSWRIEYPITIDHIGVIFTVIVDGLTSGYQGFTYFTDANIKVKASSGDANYTYMILDNLDCSGIGDSVTEGTGNNREFAVGISQSVRITAQEMNSQGFYFTGWTVSPRNATFSYPVEGDQKVICFSGKDYENGVVNFTANYVACIPPTITASDIAAVNSEDGTCIASIDFGEGEGGNVSVEGSSPVVTYTIVDPETEGTVVIESGYNFPVGTTVVTATAVNSCGTDSDTFEITVTDAEKPIFANVPSDQLNVAMDAGACGATITWTDPTANDNCDGSVSVVRTDATGYNSGDLFAAGSYTISYSATDANGNVQTNSFDVSVNADAEKPVFANVPSDQLNVAMDAGACGATITWTDPTASDNCDGSVSVVRTDATGYNSGDLFAAGSYTISYSATDSEGNVETASFAVSVNADAEKPVFANVPSDQLNVAMDAGACGATITWTDPTANDNCDGSVSVVRTDATGYNSGDLFAAGSYTISYSATDSEGNIQTASFDVSVNADAEKPVFANVPSDQLNVAMDAGACGATITWTDPTASDNCDGSVSVVRTDATGYNSGDLFAAGSYTISYSATDSEGNIQTASFDVSVNADAEKPVFANVPSDQLNVAMDAGACGATITWTDPTANDNCDGSVSVVRTDATGYNSGDLFAAGSYTISYSATDSEGNIQTASFDVSVNADAEKPVFANVPSDQLNVAMDAGACGATITWTDPTASDNCDGSVSVVRTDATGYNSGDLFAAGSYTISYSATDSEGNIQTASFAVSVNADAEKPVFANVPSDQLNVAMDAGACGATITWTDPTASDNCDGSVSVVRTDATGYNSGDLFAAGSYTISYSATDSEGNIQTASFDVSVNADAEKPVFANVPSDQLNVAMDAGACGATITWTDPTASDNCDGSVNVVRTDATGYNSGDLFAAGSYTISYSATDANGNVQTTSFDVSVNADAEKPVFADVPSDQLNVAMDAGACGATITWTDPTANDNCDGSVSVVRTDATGYNSGDLFAAGSYTISYSATDANGNVETASFNVSVNADAEKPVIDAVSPITKNTDADGCGATFTVTAPTATDNCTVGTPVGKRSDNKLLTEAFPIGETTITWTVSDDNDVAADPVTQVVTVTNDAPSSLLITGPIEPQSIGTSIKMEATFSDENIAYATWIAFNGSVVVQEFVGIALGNNTTHTFLNLPAGVYTIILTLEDYCGKKAEEKFQYITIYDPNGGFVTGGGWIDSWAGALKSDPTAAGRASFGFVSKYKKGSNQVDGNTEFQFKAGNLNFKSQMHNAGSLVIAGAKAIYKGEGTVNGTGNYGFMVSAIDGQLSGGGGTDKFRIKIWDKNNGDALVYDNQIGDMDENADATTVIGGGSIVIHQAKGGGGNNKTAQVNDITLQVSNEPITVDILGNLAVAPNPVRSEAQVRFSLVENAAVTLRVFDFNGREIDVLYQGNVNANEVYEVNFQRRNLMSGVYFVKLTTDRGHSYDKQIIVE